MSAVKIIGRTVLPLLLCVTFLFAGCAKNTPSVSSDAELSSASDAISEDSQDASSDTSSEEEPAASDAPVDTSSEPTSAQSQPAESKTPVVSREPTQSKAPVVSTPAASKEPAASSEARRQVSVTVPEGYTFMQIAALLEQKGVCSKKDFYDVCQTYTPKSFTISTSTDRCFRMEGYLFPDTYTFYKNDNPQNVVIKMLNNYHAKVGNLSENTLILASILEKEARSDEHMKLVSSVFNNRLSHSAEFPYLDADPTRDYVNNYITGNALIASPGKYAALYNTCGKRTGLPAGPICCPGLRAIRAAQNPTASEYYYFFYGKDGQNHYSKTLEEHNEQIAQYGIG